MSRAAEKYEGQLAPHYHEANEEDPVFRKRQARMFRSGFFEFFSKVHPAVPAIMFVPMMAYYAWAGWAGQSVVSFGGMFVFGFLAWTLTEYTLHRLVFHVAPRGPISKFIYFWSHGIHHQYPDDFYRLVMVPAVSVPLAFLFYFLLHLPFPGARGHAMFSGFALGYLAYDYIHFGVHHFKPPQAKALKPLADWFRGSRRRHMRHHFDDHEKGYGVSTSLWDHVFGTHDPRSNRPADDANKI